MTEMKNSPMNTHPYATLCQRLAELSHLNSALAVLQWDQEVHMPVKAAEARAKTISYLSVQAHEKLLELNTGELLSQLYQGLDTQSKTKESIVIRETWRAYDRERTLPTAFVEELSELCSVAQGAWAEARRKEDFSLFLPHLKRIIQLKRQEAEYIGYKTTPYDALLDAYEPGLTTAQVSQIVNELKEWLPALVRRLTALSKEMNPEIAQGTFPLNEQEVFNQFIVQKVGFDREAGRLDTSTHPFTTSFHPTDVRLTTRYRENDLLYAIGSTIHEMGHGLYEQGLPVEHYGTPLGETVSLGIHESQSRLWENHVGKGRSFWEYLYPEIQTRFPEPFAKIPLEVFLDILNRVTPSFIRTESDEVTYNLHIMVRFELEKDLIEGALAVEDLPRAWNKKIQDYLGIEVPNDRLGVLQDVHWSMGAFGYFPTYTLGNLYAAQLYQAAQQQVPKMEERIKQGDFSGLRDWLRTNVYQRGKWFTADELVRETTGESLNTVHFKRYILGKYQQREE